MNTLRDYVEVMFQDFPKTKANLDLKTNILDSMEDKYEDLIANGKTEQEAIGIVIAQFGNIDELKEAYGVRTPSEDVEYLPTDKLTEYVSFKQKFARFIALGVAMIIFSLLAVILMQEALGVVIFLIVVAISVAIFILLGMQSNEYTTIDQGRYHLFEDDQVEIRSMYTIFKPKFQVAITVGVVLCILSIIFFVLNDSLHVGDALSFTIFFSFIAIAVNLFIRYGVQNSMYQILLRDQETIEELQEENEFGWVYGITMPLAAMTFLAFGFLKNAWHPAWLIFPITAILTNGIVEILKRRH